MIVYVETNFVLEQAFLQEEHGSCTRLLEAAAAKKIELVLPAYSMGEPYEKLIRRRRERKQLSDRLRQELHELRRSAPYANEAEQYSDLARLLIDSNEQENQRLNEVLSRILDIATIIPTDSDVLKNALMAQRALGLSPQDSIVYAAVRKHLVMQNGTRCFINKNTRTSWNRASSLNSKRTIARSSRRFWTASDTSRQTCGTGATRSIPLLDLGLITSRNK